MCGTKILFQLFKQLSVDSNYNKLLVSVGVSSFIVGAKAPAIKGSVVTRARTAARHTCCQSQSQTKGLTDRPDGARWAISCPALSRSLNWAIRPVLGRISVISTIFNMKNKVLSLRLIINMLFICCLIGRAYVVA